jgi:hypothetical protein
LGTQHLQKFPFSQRLPNFLDDDFDSLRLNVVQVPRHPDILTLLQISHVNRTLCRCGSSIQEGSVSVPAGSHRTEGQIKHDLIHRTGAKAFDQI